MISYLYNINALEALCGGPIWVFQSINQWFKDEKRQLYLDTTNTNGGGGGLKDLQMDTMFTKWLLENLEDPPPHPT